jgi:hypothetical protein
MKAEVRYIRQCQGVFRLTFFSVGWIVCGEDLSQRLANPVGTPPLPLTDQEPPLHEQEERTGPSKPRVDGVFLRGMQDPLKY